jgi:NTP pyrophosphatase (non-canonical NTP hydrolase)
MHITEMQHEILANKQRRGFNTTDVGCEILHLTEELGELARAYRDKNQPEVNDAIADMMVYCLGLCGIVGLNAHDLIASVIEKNKTRTHRNNGFGAAA